MIHVEKLTKCYGNFCAVDQIDLDVSRGEITGLLGPNGAGKTTTLRMLTGFLEPTSGSIRINGLSYDDDATAVKKLIGYLPESAPLYHNLLVYDYLDYIAGIRGLTGRRKVSRIHELADLCGLKEIMHKNIGELSKGLRQRVGLAHAMMEDPEVLVLDEPTSGLDPNQIAEIRDIIRRFGREKTIILSTHILSEAEAACDRIVIIDKGRIAADGSTESLKEGAKGEQAIHLALLHAEPGEAQAALESVEGVLRVERTESRAGDELRLKIFASSADGIMERIYARVRQTDWVMVEFTRESKSLEKIFRQLTREEG
ncbi:MAG: ATP-binding cassette domain-containing protein [Desulfomonilia bacterium]|jgi:ABC-2 type transport system ATP-binding protein